MQKSLKADMTASLLLSMGIYAASSVWPTVNSDRQLAFGFDLLVLYILARGSSLRYSVRRDTLSGALSKHHNFW